MGDGKSSRNWGRGIKCVHRHWRAPVEPLEPLEPRVMLSADSWMNPGSGSWNVPGNWSTGAVPAAGDDVVISQAGNIQVTLAGSARVNSLAISGDALIVSGGGLSVAVNTSVGSAASIGLQSGGTMTVGGGLANSGTITVGPASQLTVSGNLSQAAGSTLALPGGGSTTNPAADLLSNPGFESPVISSSSTSTPAGWNNWGSSVLSNQYAFAGAQSLHASGGNSGVSQSFSVTPGASYTLSVYAMTPATDPLTGSEAAYLELIYYDSSGNQISPYAPPNSIQILGASSATGGTLAGSAGNQGWNQFNLSTAAPSNAATVQASLETGAFNGSGAGGGSVYWDDPQFGPSNGGPSKVVAGSISNGGVMTIGPTNTVTTSGTFSQAASGTLDLQLGGAPAAGDFGSLRSTGTASLGGTLKSDLVYGYAPSTTDEFTPIEFPAESGSFATDQLPSGTGYRFQAAVTFTNVVFSAVPTAPLTTTVNAGTALHPVASNMLGINLAWWDGALTDSQTQQLVQSAGLNAYRFPGGSSSDDYHFNVAGTSGDAYANTIPQFANFIASAGGTGLITLDYGSGSPQEAAAEMAYLLGSPTDTTAIGTGIEWNDASNQWQNVDWKTVGYWAGLRASAPLAVNDGLNFLRLNHPSAFTNIKYWEVGNEEYGNWEVDHHGTAGPGGVSTGAQHAPAAYVAFAKQFATYSSEILATAGVTGVSIGIDSGDPTGAGDNNWTRNVLTDGLSIGFVPGFISDHSYMQAPGSESDSFLLNQSVSDAGSLLDWATRYADYQSLLQQVLGSQASSVHVMATEFNSVYSNPGKQSTSLVNGLFIADSIGSLLDSGYTGGFAWDLRNGWDTSENNSQALYGWREGGDYGLLGDPNLSQPPQTGAFVPYPNYFAEQLASKIVQPGGTVVTASSNYQELHPYAVLEPNGHLELLVINTNPAASLDEQFNLTGFQPSGAAQFWQYGEAQDTAQSQSSTGSSSALANFNTTLSLTGNSFSYSFPAYSMTVIDLTPAAALTVARAAAATPNPVTAKTAALSVLGSENGSDSGLTYAWSAASVPSGAASPTFSANDTNAAKNTMVTFYKAGSYSLKATLSDPSGRSITSTVDVTVAQTLSRITVSPTSTLVSTKAIRQFSALALDQFNNALAHQPAFTWSVASGGGTISTAGLYTAPSNTGSATIKAASGSISASAAITVAAPVKVSLSSWFNRTGIYNNGATFASTGGLDGHGYALSSKLLGTSISWSNAMFTIGGAGARDVVMAAGQTIALTQGNFTSLKFLAAAVNGSQASLSFVITYTDGTKQTVKQGISDWAATTQYAGESVAFTMTYRDKYNGTQVSGTRKLYGYTIPLNASKTLKSITLPNDSNIDVLGITLIN